MYLLRIILFAIYYMFVIFTVCITMRFVVRKLINLATPPFYCNSKVLYKEPVTRSISSRTGGTFYTAYTLRIEMPAGKVRRYNIEFNLYDEIEIGNTYKFYISGDDIKEVTTLEMFTL